ncbi:MAG TPA: hypothetical protein VJW20_07235 [Candidatus Angelobacter sp.]|nr:hypothetical protein [Candidatus Angelobacter sp.]
MATSVSQSRSRRARSGGEKHYMPVNRGFTHGTAWAALFHASMDICNRYGLPGGGEQ